ncbi:hypothetical protein EX30DRAFT_392554 [Ascodesmis nigricans]|uniref:DUF7492 domain-containing protein n=1 Tax=Ascodesmis nigricans TaxID=341454 RepID=A0A4S2N7R1_9PEZI|nr:hypothetical protein EX30DRAFT_392554 [Ascodesmis nigricans]
MRITTAFTTAVFTALFSTVNSHSWVSQVQLVSGDGAGTLGYSRYYRGHIDDNETIKHLNPALNTYVCKDFTQGRVADSDKTTPQGTAYPILDASPGDRIALFWKDNGHVTLDSNLFKAPTATPGNVTVYGTTTERKLTLTEVVKWEKNGGKDGRLLTIAPYDDGSCAEDNQSKIALERGVDGQSKDCRMYVTIPEDVGSEKYYTLYWVWDFSMKTGTRTTEWYTSCIDIAIKDKSKAKSGGAPAKKKRELGYSAKFRVRE